MSPRDLASGREFSERDLLIAIVVGRYVEEVLPASSQELVKGKYREAIEGNKTVRWEEVAEMPAGRRIGEVFVTPVRDEVAGLLYLLGGVHDVTDRIAGRPSASSVTTSSWPLAAISESTAIRPQIDSTCVTTG